MEIKAAALTAAVSLVLVFLVAAVFYPPAAAESPAPTTPSPQAVVSPTASPGGGGGGRVRLLLEDGSVAVMDTEEYVYGVVAAEMPASFAPAALEAQAVCARTYALRRVGAPVHGPQADVCADPTCCQGFDPAPAARWGDQADALCQKLREAVAATAGTVLLDGDGALIDAVFHASSAGFTAPAQAVWGTAVPYLVSVSTPETDETVDDLGEERSFSREELAALLGSAELGEAVYAPWGGVETLAVGDGVLSGQEVRQRLGLRSARFTVTQGEGGALFSTLGYGHGVGMSQRGADLLAREGASFEEILAHYYPGTTLAERK